MQDEKITNENIFYKMINMPMRLLMLSEFETEQNKNNIFEILNTNIFDWSFNFEGPNTSSAIFQNKEVFSKLLKDNFHSITELRQFQQDSLEDLLINKKNIFIQNYTGSGKSLIFQLFALLNPGLTVVVSPFVAITLGNLVNFRSDSEISSSTSYCGY